MLRHACVVTLVLLVTLGFGGITTEEADATGHFGWHNRELLHDWDELVPWAAWDSFRLPFQAYERYVFILETFDVPVVEKTVPAAAYFQVEKQSTNELVCRGVIWIDGVIDKYQYCDDMIEGHHYKIYYQITVPDTRITLYGVNPIAPPDRPGFP